MKKEHFIDVVRNRILDCLPDEYQESEILIREVVKIPAGKLTGLCVKKKDRDVFSVIYLEPYFEKVEKDGIPLSIVLRDIASAIEHAGFGQDKAQQVAEKVRDYEWVSEHLVIQMFDRELITNTGDVIIYDFGPLSGMIRVMLDEECSVIATNALLEHSWHVSKERLLEDARKSIGRVPKGLWDVEDVLMHHTGNADHTNLQDTNLLSHPEMEAEKGLYVLMTDTNEYSAWVEN